MEATTYNGWTNYETWNVNLWAMNEEPLYRMVQAHPRRLTASGFSATDARKLAGEMFGDATPDGVRISDGNIDWDEIAEAWNE